MSTKTHTTEITTTTAAPTHDHALVIDMSGSQPGPSTPVRWCFT